MTLFYVKHVTTFRRNSLKVDFVRHVKGKLYMVGFSQLSTCVRTKNDVGWLWHCHLAHGDVCILGNQYHKKHPYKNIIISKRPLELLQFGPI
jgi:hypothetical protein